MGLVIVDFAIGLDIGALRVRSAKRPQEESSGDSDAEWITWRTKPGKHPLPIGHEAKGLVLPDFDSEGHLRGKFEAGIAHRIDQEHIGFQTP